MEVKEEISKLLDRPVEANDQMSKIEVRVARTEQAVLTTAGHIDSLTALTAKQSTDKQLIDTERLKCQAQINRWLFGGEGVVGITNTVKFHEDWIQERIRLDRQFREKLTDKYLDMIFKFAVILMGASSVPALLKEMFP